MSKRIATTSNNLSLPSGGKLFLNTATTLDPTLSALFASSSGPIQSHKKQRVDRHSTSALAQTTHQDNEDADEDVLSELSFSHDIDGDLDDSTQLDVPVEVPHEHNRRSKRKREDDDLEGKYMKKLAREEQKENAQVGGSLNEHPARQELHSKASTLGSDSLAIPKHETLEDAQGTDDVEKAARTVFLSNVSTKAITSKSSKKILLTHLSSFISSLPASTPHHKIESLRFRSVAFSTPLPKKAAFAKQELMDTTTKSTNAYVVYSTKVAAREAARQLNGTVVLDRHLRVDQVAHPSKIDHRRCVFVGNLGYVDDDSSIRASEAIEGKSKPRKAQVSDVDEGLWQVFGKVGKVESVRVIRDPKTRVGKGFAYVQFEDQNAVEEALQMNDKKFPPLLPRKLRVVRAKKPSQTASALNRGSAQLTRENQRNPSIRNRLASGDKKSLQGRASKLLGKAGAADLHGPIKQVGTTGPSNSLQLNKPESFVFEGHRASSTQGNRAFRQKGQKGSGKKKSKSRPSDRSAKRGAAWKARDRA